MSAGDPYALVLAAVFAVWGIALLVAVCVAWGSR